MMTYEAQFELPRVAGNPYDPEKNDVRFVFRGPGGKQKTQLGFFDGGTLWRARITVEAKEGKWQAASATRNGALVRAKLTTLAQAQPLHFVRRKGLGFVHDDGRLYWPLGHNVAWRSGSFDVSDAFAKLGAAGENWSRVWMCHWDGKNLDWETKGDTLSLSVARRWDGIVAAAQKHGVYFQLVLQHHGPYALSVNSNWGENPWNAKNGGFLNTTAEFFTHPEALRRTKNKLRYIVARWGYSPSILAWELFNEVEWTEGAKNAPKTVEAWHQSMAAHLRSLDIHRHLVTTSSHLSGGDLYAAMDYEQPHAYPPDLAATALAVTPTTKPVFYGEIGPSGDLNSDTGQHLKAGLWASLFSDASGAAQYWTWDHIERRNLYGLFKAATGFVNASGVTALRRISARVITPDGGVASSGPGKGWGETKRTEYPIRADGMIEGIGEMPSFLQGTAHREMFPKADLPVTLRQPGSIAVEVQTAARSGGTLVIKVDGQVVAEKAYPASGRDTSVNETLTAAIPVGTHKITLENPGADWVTIRKITVGPVGASVSALAKSDQGGTRAALWLRRTATGAHPGGGTVTLSGLRAGAYKLVWWDTDAGKALREQALSATASGQLAIPLPAFTGDIAAYLTRK
ncbi:cellulase family glycosylhydrolase [Armatimonas sp.]|uniref:cellulase family glycosylhydrolase n=1 Tax=Armatimonas sp. TaxID=1872638 RepID=UPI003750D13B